MASNGSNVVGGIGFPGMLTVLFIGLKLTGFIDWSWLWVLSPMWISWVLAFTIVVGAIALGLRSL